MDEVELRRRVRAGEDSRTEFKRITPGTLPPAEDIAKELSALANSGGGTLFFGIDDDGTVSGVGDKAASDQLQRHIAHVRWNSITPPLPAQLVAIAVDDKIVVATQVPEFLSDRPFRGRTKYFVRDGPLSREARPDELKRLLASAPTHYFDEQAIPSATREAALDDAVIADFLSQAYRGVPAEQAERYLAALHAIDGQGRPTVTGLVLFGREPRTHLQGAYVSAIHFPGRSATSKFDDSAEFTGDIFQQIRETVAFLRRRVAAPSNTEALERVERGVPIEVWREAVTNALTHRDYASPNQVRVFVFEDRVEIRNPGGLLNSLTVDNIRLAGTKQPRNPNIASAVARRALRENLGIGVPEIFRLVAERGLPEPEIRIEAGEFLLVIHTRG